MKALRIITGNYHLLSVIDDNNAVVAIIIIITIIIIIIIIIIIYFSLVLVLLLFCISPDSVIGHWLWSSARKQTKNLI
jgi:uncharacterized protein HemY